VGFGCDLLSLAAGRQYQPCKTKDNLCNSLVESDVVILHGAPVPPLECNCGWTTVYLENFPRKSGHHALESLVAGGEVRVLGTVELIRSDDGIVSTDLEHMLSSLRWSSVDSKGVVRMVDGTPVLQARLERCFNLPVLDEVLYQLRQATGCMVHLLPWKMSQLI
jgi:hypothetical protein